MRHIRRNLGGQRGFSAIELLVVVAIIGIVVVAALPAISQYMRNYRLRGATDEVMAEINRARNTAVMKNTNLGVSFLIVDADRYRSVVEDTATPGPLRSLPRGVEFLPAAAADVGLRFQRMGTVCQVAAPPPAPCTWALCAGVAGAAACSDPAPVGPFVTFAAGGATVTLVDTRSGLSRAVQVDPGGRLRATAR